MSRVSSTRRFEAKLRYCSACTLRRIVSLPADENPVGACVANYVSKNVVVRNANVQEMRIGVSSPFFYGQPSESNGEEGQSLLRTTTSETYLGFSVASRTPTTTKAVLC
jgi:hypothetical protein